MVLRNFEQQHIFSCTYIIVALQFPCQILQHLFEVIQKSFVMADILKCDVIIPSVMMSQQ